MFYIINVLFIVGIICFAMRLFTKTKQRYLKIWKMILESKDILIALRLLIRGKRSSSCHLHICKNVQINITIERAKYMNLKSAYFLITNYDFFLLILKSEVIIWSILEMSATLSENIMHFAYWKTIVWFQINLHKC